MVFLAKTGIFLLKFNELGTVWREKHRMSQLLTIQGSSPLEVPVRRNLGTKRMRTMAALTAVGMVGLAFAGRVAAEEGVALAIVYDTSGSMHDPVPDKSGGTSPKYLIANRALIDVARQIQAFATNNPAGTSRKIETGLFVFHNG